jgi:hypothetical protein
LSGIARKKRAQTCRNRRRTRAAGTGPSRSCTNRSTPACADRRAVFATCGLPRAHRLCDRPRPLGNFRRARQRGRARSRAKPVRADFSGPKTIHAAPSLMNQCYFIRRHCWCWRRGRRRRSVGEVAGVGDLASELHDSAS